MGKGYGDQFMMREIGGLSVCRSVGLLCDTTIRHSINSLSSTAGVLQEWIQSSTSRLIIDIKSKQ